MPPQLGILGSQWKILKAQPQRQARGGQGLPPGCVEEGISLRDATAQLQKEETSKKTTSFAFLAPGGPGLGS